VQGTPVAALRRPPPSRAGAGLRRDRARGLELLRLAAEGGHAEAQVRLGNLLVSGTVLAWAPTKSTAVAGNLIEARPRPRAAEPGGRANGSKGRARGQIARARCAPRTALLGASRAGRARQRDPRVSGAFRRGRYGRCWETGRPRRRGTRRRRLRGTAARPRARRRTRTRGSTSGCCIMKGAPSPAGCARRPTPPRPAAAWRPRPPSATPPPSTGSAPPRSPARSAPLSPSPDLNGSKIRMRHFSLKADPVRGLARRGVSGPALQPAPWPNRKAGAPHQLTRPRDWRQVAGVDEDIDLGLARVTGDPPLFLPFPLPHSVP
jgi:hypothetical protein